MTMMKMFLLALACAQAAAAQLPAPPASRSFTMTVNPGDRPVTMSLKADNARLSDVATELGRRLKAKVVLGPGVQNEKITVDIPVTMLETALISLAPRVFVDYEIRQDATPVPLGLYLLGATDPVPATDTVVRGTSQGILIEGNTEDMPKTPEEDPLRVTGDRKFLSVVVKKQPLSLVARAIGEVLGIPVETKYDANEIITATLTNGLPEETVTGLSPNLHIFVRVDVNLAERIPLKIVVEKPAK